MTTNNLSFILAISKRDSFTTDILVLCECDTDVSIVAGLLKNL